jgi:pSer/pThr/pTyr-binding forkhead associated (FHA) protein
MTAAPAAMLQYAVGNTAPIRLLVREGTAPPTTVEINSPFAVIGRAKDCDVCLSDDKVAFRHAYLQVIGGRLACIDLMSAGGIHWDGPPFEGWVSAAHRFRISNTWIQVYDDGWNADPDLKSPLEFKPRTERRPEYGILPQVDLELLTSAARGTLWPINRVITLVGRDDRCRITCGDENISKVHCSLLLLPTGLWVIDLLGKGGVKVNGEKVRCGLLTAESELEIGRYKLRPRYTIEQIPMIPSGAMPDPSKADFLTRLNRLFRIESYADALILLPNGDAPSMTYKEIHVESSRISELQTAHGYRHLVIDGTNAPILTSMVLDAIISFCRQARGKVAFCNLSEELLSSVQSMNLDRIWPVVAGRAEALQYVYAP